MGCRWKEQRHTAWNRWDGALLWNRMVRLLVGLMWMALGAWACSSGEPCSPGATRQCSCSAGPWSQSIQLCNADGKSWGDCLCTAGHEDPPHETVSGEVKTERQTDEHAQPEEKSVSLESQEESAQDAGEMATEQDGGTLLEGIGDGSVPSESVGEMNTDADISPLQRLHLDVWPWGAEAVVSLSIDDGLAAPFVKLIPEIEKRGWRATLFITTEFATDKNTWSDIKKAYQAGHDIGAHTHTHRNLTKLTEQEIHEEFTKPIAELQSRLDWKIPLQSFAYPYEASNSLVESIVQQYHRYARGGDQGVSVPPNPVPLNDPYQPNFLFLQAKAPTRNYTVQQWNSWVDEAVKQKKWLIEEYHGVDDQDWEPRSMTEYRAHFDHIETYGRKIWVAPITRVGHYIDERQTAFFTVVQWTSQEIILNFSSRFGASHREPLTYSIQIPAAWKWADIKVIQDGKVQRHERLGPSLFRAESMPDKNLAIRIIPQ